MGGGDPSSVNVCGEHDSDDDIRRQPEMDVEISLQ